MSPLPTFLSVAHLVGLVLGLGAATVKFVLLIKCRIDPAFVPVYLNVSKPVTRQIVLGIIILTSSGAGWLLIGYGFTAILIVKIILVVGMWVLGPLIDNVIEPRLHRLAPASGAAPSAEFRKVQNQYFGLELTATVLFWLIFALGAGI